MSDEWNTDEAVSKHEALADIPTEVAASEEDAPCCESPASCCEIKCEGTKMLEKLDDMMQVMADGAKNLNYKTAVNDGVKGRTIHVQIKMWEG